MPIDPLPRFLYQFEAAHGVRACAMCGMGANSSFMPIPGFPLQAQQHAHNARPHIWWASTVRKQPLLELAPLAQGGLQGASGTQWKANVSSSPSASKCSKSNQNCESVTGPNRHVASHLLRSCFILVHIQPPTYSYSLSILHEKRFQRLIY